MLLYEMTDLTRSTKDTIMLLQFKQIVFELNINLAIQQRNCCLWYVTQTSDILQLTWHAKI